MPSRSGRVFLAGVLAIACNSSPAPTKNQAPPSPPSPGAVGAPQPAEIISCVDLPRDDARSHNLSGLAWDPAERRLLAISDRDKALTVLAPRPGFAGFDFLPSIALDVAIDSWDGEALAIAGDRLVLVANETQAAVFSVDRSGHGATRLALPALPGVRDNLGLEAIGYVASAGDRYVFAANEEALEGDGPTSTVEHGTVVRIRRHSLDGGTDLEAAYVTDPIFADGLPGNNGVSDLAALSPDRLLLIERAWVKGKGNSIRIYAIDLHEAQNVIALADARAVVPVHKRLVVDLAALPDARCAAPPAPQRSRTLDNYEGLALGPTLEDGRQVIFMVTDDNLSANQVPRLITLALAPGAL